MGKSGSMASSKESLLPGSARAYGLENFYQDIGITPADGMAAYSHFLSSKHIVAPDETSNNDIDHGIFSARGWMRYRFSSCCELANDVADAGLSYFCLLAIESYQSTPELVKRPYSGATLSNYNEIEVTGLTEIPAELQTKIKLTEESNDLSKVVALHNNKLADFIKGFDVANNPRLKKMRQELTFLASLSTSNFIQISEGQVQLRMTYDGSGYYTLSFPAEQDILQLAESTKSYIRSEKHSRVYAFVLGTSLILGSASLLPFLGYFTILELILATAILYDTVFDTFSHEGEVLNALMCFGAIGGGIYLWTAFDKGEMHDLFSQAATDFLGKGDGTLHTLYTEQFAGMAAVAVILSGFLVLKGLVLLFNYIDEQAKPPHAVTAPVAFSGKPTLNQQSIIEAPTV